MFTKLIAIAVLFGFQLLQGCAQAPIAPERVTPTFAASMGATSDKGDLAAKKAAAAALLKKDVIKILYVGRRSDNGVTYTLDIEAYPQKLEMVVFGTSMNCEDGPLATVFGVDLTTGNVVFEATPSIKRNCPNLRFVVDPLSKAVMLYKIENGTVVMTSRATSYTLRD